MASNLSSSPPPPLPLEGQKPAFVDDSTKCAICLDSLEDSGKVITLRCGHRWHLDCILDQIEFGSMTARNYDERILFNGCQCAKCGSIFGEDDHPDLPKDLIRKSDMLRSKVHALIEEHNLLKEISTNLPSKEALYKQAMRKYAFYLCNHCKDPYFGGTIECADHLGISETKAPETRLCPACAPQAQTICQNPSEHGKYLTWKCRYCCKPSTHVCYGNKHFCDDCHEALGGPMKAIPCPGDSCPYPKPHNHNSNDPNRCSKFHCNGSSEECEQVYSCVICDSIGASGGTVHDPFAIEPGSRNFLDNPSGAEGLNGWSSNPGAAPWRVEQHSEQTTTPPLLQTPVLGSSHRPPITTNFVSSYMDCLMNQTVDLTKVLRLGNDASNTDIPSVVRVEVSARYTGRTDCPSMFQLYAVLEEGDPSVPLVQGDPRRQLRRTGALEAPPGGYWERASLELEVDTTWKRPLMIVLVGGRDGRGWAGNYGSKVADITVRVVGLAPEEMEALVIPPQVQDE